MLNDRASAPSETSEPDGACTSIEDLLNKLALTDFKDVFAKEQIDMETLVSSNMNSYAVMPSSISRITVYYDECFGFKSRTDQNQRIIR